MKKQHDQFLLLVAAGVVIVSAVLVLGVGAGWWKNKEVQVYGARTEYSSNQLMKVLQTTVDDGGKTELDTLKNDAKGL